MYVVKHNIPTKTFLPSHTFSRKKDALHKFREIEKWCMKMNFPVKSFLRDTQNKPLRATLKVEVDNFTYYAELYAL